MLGTRGCRLGILYPEIYEMQVEAIMRRRGRDGRARRSSRSWSRSSPTSTSSRSCAAGGRDRRRARSEGRRGLHRRDDDRAAAGVLRGEPDRRARRLLPLRDERPHADGARVLARRRRVASSCRRTWSADHRPLAVRDDRQAGRRLAGAARSWVGREAHPGSSSGSAASTAAIPSRSTSSTWPGSTTCRARRSACRSPAWPPRRRRLHILRDKRPARAAQAVTMGACSWPTTTPPGSRPGRRRSCLRSPRARIRPCATREAASGCARRSSVTATGSSARRRSAAGHKRRRRWRRAASTTHDAADAHAGGDADLPHRRPRAAPERGPHGGDRLGHDVGHPPFGHIGEEVLDACSRERFGRGFRHNEHSLRVVERVVAEPVLHRAGPLRRGGGPRARATASSSETPTSGPTCRTTTYVRSSTAASTASWSPPPTAAPR